MRSHSNIVLGLLVLATAAFAQKAVGEPIRLRVSDVHVTDGDTIKVDEHAYRLVGFDTPETWRPRCSDEAARGKAATDRLRQLVVNAKELTLERVACSCAPNAPEETPTCNYGRRCGTLRVDGEDVGAILIRESLAQSYPYRWDRPPRKPTWCDRPSKASYSDARSGGT